MKVKVNLSNSGTWWVEYNQEHRNAENYNLFAYFGAYIHDSPHKDSFRIVGTEKPRRKRLKFSYGPSYPYGVVIPRPRTKTKPRIRVYAYFEEPFERHSPLPWPKAKPQKKYRRSIKKKKIGGQW